MEKNMNFDKSLAAIEQCPLGVCTRAGKGVGGMSGQLLITAASRVGKSQLVDRGELFEYLARLGRKHSPVNEAKAEVKTQSAAPYYRQFDKRKF